MSGNNNITVAMPGHDDWTVWWQIKDLENFQLDIVGFLAVLGEGAVLANAQVSALSRLFFLPRLLPAPQALIRTTRPTKLPPSAGTVTGVKSANVKEQIHHIADILLHPEMPAYTVRCVKVEINKHRTPSEASSFSDRTFRGQPSNKTEDQTEDHTEDKIDDKIDDKTDDRTDDRTENVLAPIVKAKAAGPQTWVSLLGFVEFLVLFTASITFGDGMSTVATISLSLVSTIVGICSKWTLRLPKNKNDPTVGDVVIRYENGSFLVVKCDEQVARALYFAPEEIDYLIKNPAVYRMLSLLATILLMLGIVFLANAKLQLQIGWAAAYVIINIAHWIAAALPQKAHWDLSCFKVTEQGVAGGPKSKTFTEALWKAILITKSKQWVRPGHAAPETTAWNRWLDEAEMKAQGYESKHGILTDPIWHGETRDDKGTVLGTGKVWDGPTQAEWNPNKVWMNYHKQTERDLAA